MSKITRTVTMYKYVFGVIDLDTGKATNVRCVTIPRRLKNKDIKNYCKEYECIFFNEQTFERRYSLPIEEFVHACEEYASNLSHEIYAEENDTDDNGEDHK